jgi:hypothetical protein
MIFSILRRYGIPEKIVRAIRVLYDNSTSRVYVDGLLSELLKITTGVLQGDVLAPFLFITVIDYVTKRSAGNFGYLTHKSNNNDTSGRSLRSTTRFNNIKMNDLSFADDIALLENDLAQSQLQLDSLKVEAVAVGLEINVKKTEQLQLNMPTNTIPDDLKVDDQQIANVDEFKYLGSYMVSTDKDVNMRIALA